MSESARSKTSGYWLVELGACCGFDERMDCSSASRRSMHGPERLAVGLDFGARPAGPAMVSAWLVGAALPLAAPAGGPSSSSSGGLALSQRMHEPKNSWQRLRQHAQLMPQLPLWSFTVHDGGCHASVVWRSHCSQYRPGFGL